MQQGTEVIVEHNHRPVAVIKPPDPASPGRKLSECIACAEAYEQNLVEAPVSHDSFGSDVQAAINERRDPFEPFMGIVLDSSVLISAKPWNSTMGVIAQPKPS